MLCSSFVVSKFTTMKNQMSGTQPTLQEWANFLTVLNGNKNSDRPLLKKAASPSRLVHHLDQQLPK
jgi:hypothetical protein